MDLLLISVLNTDLWRVPEKSFHYVLTKLQLFVSLELFLLISAFVPLQHLDFPSGESNEGLAYLQTASCIRKKP